jgi:hypothetical protein
MIDSKREEQLHSMFEGRLSDAQAAEVREAMTRDPALRERAAELATTFSALAGASMLEPPPGLREDVMRAVRAEAAPVRRRAGWATSWPRLALPLAAAACAVAVVAVMLAPRDGRHPQPMPVQGTIGGAASSALRTFASGRASGAYALARTGVAQAELAIETGVSPVDLEVSWPAGAVRSARPATPGAAFRSLPTGIAFTLPAGARERVLVETTDSGPLTLGIHVLVAGRIVHAGSVSTSSQGSTR